MRALILIALVACSGAPVPAPVVPPAPTDDLPPPLIPVMVTSDDIDACAAIGVIGCPEAPGCVTTIGQARTERVVVPSSCLKAAKTPAMVRACGDVSTLTFECALP